MADPYLGQLLLVGFNFAPNGWFLAQGQVLPISKYTALFSLFGVQFGGDGKTTFQLPNLQGIISNGQGQGPGLSNYIVGETGGSPTVTLLDAQNPSHNHTPTAVVGRGVTLNTTPIGHVLAESPGGINIYAAAPSNLNAQMNASAILPEGGSLPHNNIMPYLSLNWIVAWQGVFPSRG
jgi:microcystin-dependent protein